MVVFKWQLLPHSLPDDWFENEFRDYLSGDSSRSYVKDNLESLVDDYDIEESVREELISEFKKVIINVLKSPLNDFLSDGGDNGFRQFLNRKKTTETVEEKEEGETETKTKVKDLEVANVSNSKFIANKKVGHLMSDNVANRLKGDGVSAYGTLDDLPDFNVDDFDDLDAGVSVQLAFEEALHKGEPTGNYTYTHKKKHFTEGKNDTIKKVKQTNHIEVTIPSDKVEKLIDAQSDHLHEITGQTPTYKKESRRLVVQGQETEIYDYPIVIPAEQFKEFEIKINQGSGNGYYEVDFKDTFGDVYSGTSFPIIGEKVVYKGATRNPLIEEGDISLLEWASLQSKQDRTKLMITNDVVEKDGKYYKSFNASKTEDSGTTVKETTRRVIVIDFDENDPDSPYSFVKTHTDAFIRMNKGYFNDPLVVNTLTVKGSIKTVQSQAPTFAAQVDTTHKKKPTQEQKDEGEEPDRYETLKYILIGKRKYSVEAFKKLQKKAKDLEKVVADLDSKIKAGPPKGERPSSPFNESGDWKKELQINSDKESKELKQLQSKINSAKHIWGKLSPIEAERISNNAFKQKEPTRGKDGKETWQTISEKDYNSLPKEEQKKYKSAVNVISTQAGQSAVNVKDMTDFGQTKLSVGQVSGETLKEDFAKAKIECNFFIQTHGKFDMSSKKRGGGNYKLSNFVDEIKVYINDLIELVEVTPSELVTEIGG